MFLNDGRAKDYLKDYIPASDNLCSIASAKELTVPAKIEPLLSFAE